MVWYFEARLYSLNALSDSSYGGSSEDAPHAGLSQGSDGSAKNPSRLPRRTAPADKVTALSVCGEMNDLEGVDAEDTQSEAA